LVLSFHVNAHATRSDFHGLLCFHFPGNPIGRAVGNTIMRAAPKPLYKPGWSSIAATADEDNQKWLQRPLNVLKSHACTAVLIEVGYCTNPKDAYALKMPAVQSGVIAATMAGLAEFRRLKDG
jgi:N-acetylmuramoyl-L-alanine amidase